MDEFDLIVVGTGSSGTAAARLCAGAGWRVAIVDERPYGGTCPLRGCDPKKVLVGVAELIDFAQRMQGYGAAGAMRIDWNDLMAFKRTFTEPVPAERESSLREAGVRTYHGAARFVDRGTIAVGGEHLRTRHVVLAVGATPAALNLPGEEHLVDSTGFLDLPAMPKRVVFIGGGYIAFEFAHVAARAQASPIVLQRGPRVLTGFEPELVDAVVATSRDVGIDVRVDVTVAAVEKTGDAFRVSGTGAGGAFEIDCDLVVHAAGRVADLDGLALEAGDVERTKKGVAVNEFLQSVSNPAVYAVGDCADGGGLPLTPTAAAEGETAARNLLDGNRHTVDFSGLASIVYTIPSLGMTGLTEQQARERGLHFAVRAGDTTQWYTSRRVRSRISRYRILVEDESGLILGAHFLGTHTEELVNVFSLAIRAKIAASALASVLFGYPTPSSDISEILQAPTE